MKGEPVTLTQTLLRSPLVGALASPHGIDRYLELVHPMWTVHEVRARIVDLRRETRAGEPVTTLTLAPNRAWAGHQAGQYVQVGVEVDGARRTRCFSVSSPESKPGDLIQITLRANPDGIVSKHLATRAKVGDVLHLSQAEGEFTLPNPLPTEILLISGGSGITPVMSILRTLLRRGYGGTVTFLHFAQSPDHQIYAEELAALPPNIRVHLVHGHHLFRVDHLERLVPAYRDTDTWVCGPAGLVEKIQAAYDTEVEEGAQRPSRHPRLRVEFFKLATLASPTDDATGTITFTRAGQEAENTGATLLEQAEAQGLRPEFGCRMGICFSCTSRKSAGTVRNVLTGEVSALPDEDIRICVSTPVGDCHVDL